MVTVLLSSDRVALALLTVLAGAGSLIMVVVVISPISMEACCIICMIESLAAMSFNLLLSFMLKEIFEQPKVIRDCLTGRIQKGRVVLPELDALDVPYEVRVVSAHRTPDLLFEYAASAEARGLEVIIAGAGGAAHLPGMAAAKTVLPVLGVPVQSQALKGLDSLLSIVQMPGGIPVGTLAIGKAGAINAALLAAALLGNKYPPIREAVRAFRARQTEQVLAQPDPRSLPL